VNATLVTDLMVHLRERGLQVTKPILAVIDGSKALRRAILDVFDHALIHRCLLHKVRSVEDRLPDSLGRAVAKKMRAAYCGAAAGGAARRLGLVVLLHITAVPFLSDVFSGRPTPTTRQVSGQLPCPPEAGSCGR
jgi:hypothetical protein